MTPMERAADALKLADMLENGPYVSLKTQRDMLRALAEDVNLRDAEINNLVDAIGAHVSKRKEYYDRMEQAESLVASLANALSNAQKTLAMMTDPEQVRSTTAMLAFSAAVDAECAARAALSDPRLAKVLEECNGK